MPASKPSEPKTSGVSALPTTLRLSPRALFRLRQRAEAIGISEAELATKLLEVIAQDDLYDAVLDKAEDA